MERSCFALRSSTDHFQRRSSSTGQTVRQYPSVPFLKILVSSSTSLRSLRNFTFWSKKVEGFVSFRNFVSIERWRTFHFLLGFKFVGFLPIAGLAWWTHLRKTMKMSSLILNTQLYILKSNLAANFFFTSFSCNFVGLIYLPLSLFNCRVNVSIRIIAFN